VLVIINALKSISRSKGRNILIGIIVVAIAAASCVALAIRNAANEAEAASTNLVNITASISVDRQKLMESAQSSASSSTDSSNTGNGPVDISAMQDLMAQYPDLTLAQLKDYANSDYVKNFYYSGTTSLDATGDLQAYTTENTSSDSSNNSGDNSNTGTENAPSGMIAQGENQGGGNGPVIAYSIGGNFGMALGDFSVTGYSAEDAMTDFINGTSQVTTGSMFTFGSSDMKCLISTELATYNGLSVGDTITLSNPNVTDETYTLTIAGIYTNSSSTGSSNGGPRFSTAQDPANLIIVSYDTLQKIIDNSTSVATTSTDDNGNAVSTALSSQLASTFVFATESDYNNFGSELTAKGLSDYYVLSSSDISNYQASLVPLQNLSSFATTLLLIILAIGAVVLVVINIFNIRERKYEVGVLTAIGIKKRNVALQFVAELFCVTLVAIIIGAGVGAIASVPVADNLLSSQIEQTQSQTATQNQNFGRPGQGTTTSGSQSNSATNGGGQTIGGGPIGGGSMMSLFGNPNGQSSVTYLDEINATVNLPILGELILIGIILTIISSAAAIIFVLRYEPLKILANRT